MAPWQQSGKTPILARLAALLVALWGAAAAIAETHDTAATTTGCANDETLPSRGAITARYTSTDIAGEAAARQMADTLPPDEIIEYEIYVPAGYCAGRPAGLLVYISPTPGGAMPEAWAPVLDEHNLVWIGANGSGNRERVARRQYLALLAPFAAAKDYRIDSGRVYVAGFSGGGKVASRVAVDYANLFRGALFIAGADFWDVDEPARLDEVRRNRYVFITGTHDQALEPMREVHRRFLEAGVAHARFMEIRDYTHRLPRRYAFADALRFIEGLDPAP